MNPELEIEIDKSGRVTMRTRGITGPVCMDLADWIAQTVGREESRQKTRDYDQTESPGLSRHSVAHRPT
jgi:hypothetical protein